ncbi:hypothetical protein BHE74_00046395 [Ensete ventricosum]|uniref:Uncharacterized protein n=1 Tax=Ensete ventricosum TaxID=4639 RepID=A0A444BYU1_ENSVE|nr:hypothetical protein B296_00046898 [Ensete ventricosum]RWV78762.1 hypothetical protein GW17_00060217 [Ensete ventricosum]RWW47594.1 hypothetical protein BHE74_00046395 [Ensete ventricosum]RZS14972.1 hypothetical protein BHM03_00046759 [Ensete ventricosum]
MKARNAVFNALFDGVVVVEFEDAVASSCAKKTTTMSAAQVVFCNAMFDGVVVVEFKDAVAGSWKRRILRMRWLVPARRRP